MKPTPLSVTAALVVGAGFALAPGRGHAAGRARAAPLSPAIVPVANWRHPYSNVDHCNDIGNDTGDA